jgi:two-component system NtrC family sensor kinase
MIDRLFKSFGLRFEDSAEERRFVSEYIVGNVGWTQIAMVLGAFTYAGYTFWDWVLYPEVVPTTLAIRGGTAILFLLPMTLLLSTPARRWAEPIYLLYCVVPGCILPTVYLVLPSGFTFASAGMIIIILFVSTMLPLRVGSLSVFCISSWIAFAVAEHFAPDMSPGLSFINHFLIGNSYALSLYAVGAREFRARRQFQTSEALQAEKERSEDSLRELRATQAQLVQAEKLASLGQLVAGVGHEVSTPLGLAVTTSTAMRGDIAELRKVLTGGPVRRSDLTKGIDRIEEGIRLTWDNLNRASEMVDSFKQVAVDQTSAERRRFELSTWLAELEMKIRPLLRRQGVTVEVECPPDIQIDGYPGALGQVLSILAFNAAAHAYPDAKSGVLNMTVTRPKDGRIEIACWDTGVGIAADIAARVFDPFFTTRRERGNAGLGLHVAFNVVVSTLGGTIAVDTAQRSGARFVLNLPIAHPDGTVPAF